MQIKKVTNYTKELAEIYPQIPEEEIFKMMTVATKLMTGYMKGHMRGFVSKSRTCLIDDSMSSAYTFKVSRIWGYRSLNRQSKKFRTIERNKKLKQDGKAE